MSSFKEAPDEALQQQIRDDLSTMSFEEIMKLKDQLGAKVYKEAVLGVATTKGIVNEKPDKFKRLNKNRPREESAKKPVPFLGTEKRSKHKTAIELRDPRFDERTGSYNVNKFKENYKFIRELREQEIKELKGQLNGCTDQEERQRLKKQMLSLINKNVEEASWHKKQQMLKEERASIQKIKAEGQRPHYTTKRERRVKELVAQFEELKKKGRLSKHLEKRRKKNAAKDRKKIDFS